MTREKGGVFRPSRNCQIAALGRGAVKVSRTPTPRALQDEMTRASRAQCARSERSGEASMRPLRVKGRLCCRNVRAHVPRRSDQCSLAPINALRWARGNWVKVASAASVASGTLVCSACTQNNEVRHVVVKSSWGPDGGNPSSTRQGRSRHRTPARGRPVEVHDAGPNRAKAKRCERRPNLGELANGSEARIRRTGGRIGDGVGTKFCGLPEEASRLPPGAR